MSFMQPQVYHTSTYSIDNKYGETDVIEADLVGDNATVEDMRDYLGGGKCYNGTDNDDYYEDVDHPAVLRIRKHLARAKTARKAHKLRKALDAAMAKWGTVRQAVPLTPDTGWVAYMSAPGYMDRTDSCTFETEAEALDYLLDMYGTQDDGEPEDWEEKVQDRLKELGKEAQPA